MSVIVHATSLAHWPFLLAEILDISPLKFKTNVLSLKFMNYTTKKSFFLRLISHNRPTDRDRPLRETYVGKRNMLRRRWSG